MAEELYNDPDFIELVIKNIIMCPDVYEKARALKVSEEDFGGIAVYRSFIKAAMDIGEAPVNSKLLTSKIKQAIKDGELPETQKELASEFIVWLYNEEPLNSKYVLDNLSSFVENRRYQRLTSEDSLTAKELAARAIEITQNVQMAEKSGNIIEYSPFENLVMPSTIEAFGTGFPTVDAVAYGISLQEFGMILGQSGSGKTSIATYMSLKNALNGRKVLYLSLEEPGKDICARLYANQFSIPYTDIHYNRNGAGMRLEEAFRNASQERIELLSRVKVHDLRDVTPVTARFIQNYIDGLYERTGWHPDLIMIDQLDYIDADGEYESAWQKCEKAAFELDNLCNHRIGGKHKFAMWLLHQVKGKLQKHFTADDIASFRGVIKPADMVLCIGKDGQRDNNVDIFSLKSRHAPNFRFPYTAELEYMNFSPMDNAAVMRLEQEAKDKAKRKKGDYRKPLAERKPSAFNVPAKEQLLPLIGENL